MTFNYELWKKQQNISSDLNFYNTIAELKQKADLEKESFSEQDKKRLKSTRHYFQNFTK